MGKRPKFDPNQPFKTVTDEAPKFDPNKPFDTVKKKETTVSEAESTKPLSEPGSSESGAVSEQQVKPSLSLTGSPSDPLGIGEVIAKTVYSGFAHQLPSAIASLPSLNNQSYEDYLMAKEPSNTKRSIGGDLFLENLKNMEFKKAFSVGDQEIKEKFLSDLKSKIGEKEYSKNKKAYETGLAEKTLAGRKKYEETSSERQALLGGVPQSYQDIKDAQGAAQYLSFQFGQAIPTMVAAGLAPGLGSYVLEATDSYNENLEETAKALKKTPHEVIEQQLDKPAKEIASNVGLINAALDVGGLGSIAAGFRKLFTKQLGKDIAKKSLSSKLVNLLKDPLLIEPVTETIQEANTAFSSQKAAGKSDEEAWGYVKENYPRLVDSFIGGLTGAGGAKVIMGKTVNQTITDVQQSIKSIDDIPAVEKAAEQIIEKVKATPEEGVKDDRIRGEQQVSSEERIGEEPIKTEPVEGGSTQETRASGMVQKPFEEKEVKYPVNPVVPKVQGQNYGYTPLSNLSKEQSELEKNTFKSLDTNYKEKKKEYQEKFGNVIDTDLGRTLIPEYKDNPKENASAVQAPVSSFLLNVYKDELNQPAPEGKKNKVNFIVGGAGSGKTTYTNNIKETDNSQIIFNTFFSNLRIAKNQINRAVNAGKKVDINYIYRDPKQSYESMLDRSNEERRIVPLVDFLKGHTESNKVIRELIDQYKGDENVKINIIDNSDLDYKKISEKELPSINEPELKKSIDESKVTEEQPIQPKDNIEPVQGGDQGTREVNAGDVNPPGGTGSVEGTIPTGKEKQFAVAKRILASDINPAIKKGIQEQGDSYIPKGLNITVQEAQDLIDFHGTEKSEALIRDASNGITPDTRVVMSGKLYDQYSKEGQNEKAVDTAIWAENFLMQVGRAANAGKFWKMITSSGEDQIVLAIEREQQAAQEKALSGLNTAQVKEQLDTQIRRLVEEKVQQTIEGRLDAAKLITKEKRKEIGDFFDKLKIDTKNNIATASVLPIGVLPHVWNAAIDVIKQAVLTGADVANAIQAGIDHIKANQKEPFDEQKFRDEFTPEIQKIMPKKKIKVSDIELTTPKITGKKKTDFINKVVDAYNDGTLTDKKFDEIYASKLGFREFTSEDRSNIRSLAKTVAEAEKYEEVLRKDFTRENIATFKGLLEEAKKANKLLQEYSQEPSNIWDTLISVMQGNLLSPISLVSNVWYNMTFQPLRFLSTGTGSLVDYSLSKLAKFGLLPKTLEDRTIDMAALQKGYFAGGWNGTLEGLKQLKTGTQADERNLREIHNSFNPGKAVSRWANKDRTTEQKINDFVEGTTGWSAEAMFRMLNLGDKPWKRAAENAAAYELGTKKGLTGTELEKFMLIPDEQSKEEIAQAGQEATFQQTGEFGKKIQSGIANFLNTVAKIPVIGGPAKVILKSQLPYIKTPWNLVVETLDYAAPPLTLARGAYNIAHGNKRSGSILIGKAIVGSMIWSVATNLFLKGLMTGDDDKDKKKRDFQKEGNVPPPNSINTSAISRGLVGQGWETQDNDTWVSYSKMGVIGICFDNYANIYKERIANKGDISGGPESYITDMLSSAPRVASSSLDQTFLQGTSTLLEAIKDGGERKTQNWLAKTTEAVGSIVLPNTFSTLSKASDEYSRDTEDEQFLTRLANTYKTKVFMGDELPAKVNLWGDKITGSPEGRNKYVYYLFDPSKFKNVDTNDFRYRLYNSFKKDYDSDWLPSMPQRKISVDGESHKLTPKEYEELCIDVGKERTSLISAYVNSEMASEKDDKIVKEELKMRYDLGYELGKEKFMINHGMNVKFKYRTPLELKSLNRKMNRLKKNN